ncbi:MAG: hypothetical protein ACM3JD_14405 [Rudaea sp.]
MIGFAAALILAVIALSPKTAALFLMIPSQVAGAVFPDYFHNLPTFLLRAIRICSSGQDFRRRRRQQEARLRHSVLRTTLDPMAESRKQSSKGRLAHCQEARSQGWPER